MGLWAFKTIKTKTGTTNATATLVTAVATRKIKVIAYSLISLVATSVTLTFKSGAAGTALWTVPLLAITDSMAGANLATSAPSFLFATNAGALLELSWGAAVNVTYSIAYFDDDAT